MKLTTDITHTSRTSKCQNETGRMVVGESIAIHKPSVPFDLAVKVSGGMEGGIVVRRSTIVVRW